LTPDDWRRIEEAVMKAGGGDALLRKVRQHRAQMRETSRFAAGLARVAERHPVSVALALAGAALGVGLVAVAAPAPVAEAQEDEWLERLERRSLKGGSRG
jgi:hypothetical protein